MGNIVSLCMSVIVRPGAALKNLKDEGENTGIISSLIFVVVMTIVSGLIASMIGIFNPPLALIQGPLGKGGMWLWYLVLGPLVILAGSFTSAFFLWGITDGFFKGSLPQYKMTYRLLALTAAFYPISAIVTSIPKVGVYLGWGLQAWVVIFVVWGLISVRGAKTLQTALIILITIALLALAAYFGPIIGQNIGVAPTFPTLGGADTGELYPADEGVDQIDRLMEEEAQKGTAPAQTKTK